MLITVAKTPSYPHQQPQLAASERLTLKSQQDNGPSWRQTFDIFELGLLNALGRSSTVAISATCDQLWQQFAAVNLRQERHYS